MELLGAVASALTLVEILIRSTEGIQRLRSNWKNAPTAINSLREELERSKDVLSQLDGILHVLEITPTFPPFTISPLSTATTLKRKIEETSATLHELQSILGCFSQHDSTECRYRWVKSQNNIDKKMKALQSSHRGIQEFLQFWNTQQQHIIGMRLQGLSEDVRTVASFCYRQTFLDIRGGTHPRPATLELEATPEELHVVLPRLRSLQSLATSSPQPCPTLEDSLLPPLSESSSSSRQNRNIDDEMRLSYRVAIRPGFVEFLDFLMRSQVNVHLPNDSGETPWLLAAQLMLPEIPHALAPIELKKKLSIIFPQPDWSKLRFNHLHMVISGLRPLDLNQVLKDPRYRSQLNSKDALGQTPLSLAAMMGNVDAVKALLVEGASVESCGSDLLRKTIHSRSKLCLESLLIPTLNPLALDNRGATLVHTVAAGCDNLDLLEPLMLAGVPLDSLNLHKCTPLSFTPLNDNHKLARFLLSKGANIDNVDKDGDTPLTEAVRLNAHNCLRLFIESGANLETVNRRGWGVLHFAGAYGDTATLQILSTARLNTEPWTDHEGNTPRELFGRRHLVSLKVVNEFERLLAGMPLTNRKVSSIPFESVVQGHSRLSLAR
ncbi:hypothetical protein FSARC_12849 [Fusarium sarcochroum]|uniref:Ankyrin repeat protein n=1 Tax=Fusarium sarcochroum TaxID=1208366 RepID=A0A8H4T5P0_9HYPO|nr:hypothetical protein FSARC_12849 [Fusarium sarcochroum]